MEILFCGTAAAEAWPALFCTCAPCATARQRGGKNLRTRAAYMLDDRVRIDFGPDSNAHAHAFGLDYSRLDHLLVTHGHDDHWFPVDIAYRRKGFSDVDGRILPVHGNEAVRARFESANGDDWARFFLQFTPITPWTPIDLGGGWSAEPIVAAHDTKELCVNYLLEADGRRVLLAHDTGWYADETWDRLNNRSLSVVAIDCTYGAQDHVRGHLGCEGVVRVRDEMDARGALAPDARVFATHFSHNGGWLHEELEQFFTPHGIDVAFDGMRVAL